MKIQFKHQKFQADAAKAIVDVFASQPYLSPSYMMDSFYEFKGWQLPFKCGECRKNGWRMNHGR